MRHARKHRMRALCASSTEVIEVEIPLLSVASPENTSPPTTSATNKCPRRRRQKSSCQERDISRFLPFGAYARSENRLRLQERRAQGAFIANLRAATADAAVHAVPLMARLAHLLRCAGLEGVAVVAQELGVTEDSVHRWQGAWRRPAPERMVDF